MYSLVLFDGLCPFCNGAVDFLLRQDRKGVFRFAALQSDAGRRVLSEHGFDPSDLSSLVVIEEGKVFRRSDAALRIAARLPLYWRWLLIFRIIPRPLREGAYRLFSRNRYRLFGKRDQCRLPEPQWRERFL